MKSIFFLISRQFCLLILVCGLLFSCNRKDKEKNKDKNLSNIELPKVAVDNKNVFFSVSLKAGDNMGFNIEDKYFHSYYLEFTNQTDKDTTITKKWKKIFKDEIVYYGGGHFSEGKLKLYNHYYLFNNGIQNVKFNFNEGDVKVIGETKIFKADSLFDRYIKFSKEFKKTHKQKEELENELQEIFLEFEKEYSKKQMKYALLLNQYQFIDKLQMINPLDNRVKSYLEQIDIIIAGEPIDNVIFNYVRNRVNNFDFDQLNEKKYSKKYIKLLSIGMFNFLRFEDNKGDKKYQSAIEWLKTTEIYKNDSIYIKKEITPLENSVFKSKLKNLSFTKTDGNKIDLKQIIRENPSNYYLIDFWATWCAPCIKGVKTMKTMDIPKNVKVVSISVDKEKDKEKWVKMTKNLEQDITFWLDEKESKTKEFMNFIEMQSVPRYILIDKNMNLIDQAFYHPHEPQFLSKLQDVKNHKYW